MTRYKHRIIVEGMDGSGKTTLIKELVARNPDFFEVPGLGPSDDFGDRLAALVDQQDDGRVPVHDRLFFSELVYGPIIRGAIAIEEPGLSNFAWFFRQTAFLIYCRPPVADLRAGADTKPQMPGVISRWPKLLEAYDGFMMIEKEWFGDRFFHYSWTRPEELEQLESRLKEYVKV